MSENLKKLREENPKRKVAPPTILGKPWRTPKEFATKTTEELERKAEEARKEEQRIKEQFKEETKGVMEVIINDFETLMLDERQAIDAYKRMVNFYGELGWRKIFGDILNDEKEHLTKLRISLEAIKEVYKKKGEISFE